MWIIKAQALRKALCDKNVPAKVYVGMRYWHPFTEEAIEQVRNNPFLDKNWMAQ